MALAVLAIPLWGCGSGENPAPLTGATNPPSAATGVSSEVVPTTGATGATEAAEANPNDPGAGDEEAARTPVAIGLKNGGLTKRTAKVVHVPSFIAIELDIDVADAKSYSLAIDYGSTHRSVTYDKPGSYKLMVEGRRPGKTVTIALLNGEQVTVKADADPGP
ncbi:MAG: hypothetical protein ACRDKI_11045 [Solirubrobacterales bacterium]